MAIDYSESSASALDKALGLAHRRPDASLHLAHVLEPPRVASRSGPALALDAQSLESEKARLGAFAGPKIEAWRAEHAGRSVHRHILRGHPADRIAWLCNEIGADLLVAGTHGRKGIARLLLGSVAERLVRIAPCPVLVVPVTTEAETADAVPNLVPACPRCVEARRESHGRELWCAQHRERHGRRHTYHEVDRNDHAHSSNSLLIRTWGFGSE